MLNGNVVELTEDVLIMDSKDQNTAQNVIKWTKDDMYFSNSGIDGPYKSLTDMISEALAQSIINN